MRFDKVLRKLLLASTTLFILATNCYAEKLIIEPEMGRAPVLYAIKNAKSSVDMG